MLKFLPIALLLVIGMLGCRTVQPADVIGTWVVTEQSRQGLPSTFQKALARIVVNADGTFVASELPEELPPVPPYDMKSRMRLDSGSGVWKLASWEGTQHLQLEFRTLESADGRNQGPYGFPLILSRAWSAVDLYYSLGDPDQARRVELKKQ